jgi:Family of unknown function (DUF5678)
MLHDELKYFIDHQDELVKQYKDKYIVIKDQRVIGAYDSEFEAYNVTKEQHALGTFLIQKCEPGASVYTQSFNSRAIFA